MGVPGTGDADTRAASRSGGRGEIVSTDTRSDLTAWPLRLMRALTASVDDTIIDEGDDSEVLGSRHLDMGSSGLDNSYI